MRCECRKGARRDRLLAVSRIPARYEHCTIDGFEIWDTDEAGKRLLQQARRKTKEFVDCFPSVSKGLLYIGKTGTGKTHLAVAALREIVLTKGKGGLYANAIDLVQELQMTFDHTGRPREEIITPVVEAPVLVLDELGAGKPSPWVQDLFYYIINSRYMAERITLFTTNYSDFPKSRGAGLMRTEESLADRISAPLRSRLYEMCDLVEIRCEGDYRERAAGSRRRRA